MKKHFLLLLFSKNMEYMGLCLFITLQHFVNNLKPVLTPWVDFIKGFAP